MFANNPTLKKNIAISAYNAVMEGHIAQGHLCTSLEIALAKALDVPFVTMTSSCSAALYMTLKLRGITAGDEVIVPNHSYVGIAHAVQLCGARVRVADSIAGKTLVDPLSVAQAITKNSKAIIVVHPNGREAPIDDLEEIAKKHSLYLIEDGAQALFSQSQKNPLRYIACNGNTSCFSLGSSKLINSGSGGFICSFDKEEDLEYKKLRNQGYVEIFSTETPSFGFNFRYPDVLATIAMEQLKAIEYLQAQRRNSYKKLLDWVSPPETLLVDLEKGMLPLWMDSLSSQKEKVPESYRISPPLANLNESAHIPGVATPHSETLNRQLLRVRL